MRLAKAVVLQPLAIIYVMNSTEAKGANARPQALACDDANYVERSSTMYIPRASPHRTC